MWNKYFWLSIAHNISFIEFSDTNRFLFQNFGAFVVNLLVLPEDLYLKKLLFKEQNPAFFLSKLKLKYFLLLWETIISGF